MLFKVGSLGGSGVIKCAALACFLDVVYDSLLLYYVSGSSTPLMLNRTSMPLVSKIRI